MKIYILSFAILFSGHASAQNTAQSPAETLKDLFAKGSPVSFLEINDSWFLGECFVGSALQPSFHLATSGFKKTFGEDRGPLFPAYKKGFFFATIYESNAPFGRVYEDRFLRLNTHRVALAQDATESKASWDSRSPRNTEPSLVSSMVFNETLLSPESIFFRILVRRAGSYYVSHLISDNMSNVYCYQIKATID